MNRIHYYSDNDLSIPAQFHRIDVLLNCPTLQVKNVNDVLELYAMHLILNTEIAKKSIDEKTYATYKQKVPNIFRLINCFFQQLQNDTYIEAMRKIDTSYLKLFWTLFTANKCYESISEKTFEKSINIKRFLVYILQNKQLTKHYSTSIKTKLLTDPHYYEVFLSYYLGTNQNNKQPLYFEIVLSKDDQLTIVKKFVDCNSGNPTFLKLISESKNIGKIKISTTLRVEAKRQYERKIQELFANSNPQYYKTYSSIQPIAKGITKVTAKEHKYNIIYNRRWLEKHYDYPTILNNLIYVFQLVDVHTHWNNVICTSNISTIESLIVLRGTKEFDSLQCFQSKRSIKDAALALYISFLNSKNITIEAVIKYFFEKYLPNNFGVKGFKFNIPTGNNLSKIRSLLSEMDSILQQFNIYCKKQQIDRDLLELNTESLNIDNVSSLIKEKYVYPTKKMINLLSFLFSDQSLLFFKFGQNLSTPYKRLAKVKIDIHEIDENDKSIVHALIKSKILYVVNNILRYNKRLLSICYELYEWGYIDRQYCNETLKYLESQNMIKYRSSLLSQQECNTFNFIMNSRLYIDSLDIRNKYLHGTQQNNPEEIYSDYLLVLNVVLLLVIKINDEFSQISGGNSIEKQNHQFTICKK